MYALNAISFALDKIKQRIPKEVLNEVFKDEVQNWRRAPVSLDEKILEKVIRPRVLVDANIYAADEVIVELDNLTGQYFDEFTVMYEIPMDRTNNRPIISVKSIGYLPYAVSFSSFGAGVGVVGPAGISDLTGAGQRVGDAASNIPPVSEATIDLIGLNTVLIRNFRRITAAYHLRCVVANEDNLNNINPRSYDAFYKLCEHAVKSYIYTDMLVKIDRAYLSGGQELPAFKNYVDTLVDSGDNYDTYLREVWGKTAWMNNVLAHQRLIKVQINPGI